jgi:L-sorbose 1-phosphate reductase
MASSSVPLPPTMRALVLDGIGWDHLSIRRVPTPRPAPTQLLARVDAAGICTSLLKLIDQGPKHSLMGGWDPTEHPIILGDEGSITLVEVGAALQDRYKVGDRFVIQASVDHAPINHRERYANNADGMKKIAAGYTLGGHLAEYILVGEEILAAGCLLPLPFGSRLPYAHAAMGEPISCCISSQDHHLHLTQSAPTAPRAMLQGLKPGGVTVIIGAGAMGRMQVDIAISYHPAVIISADHHEDRLARVRDLYGARAQSLGIDLHAVNTYETDLKALVERVTHGRGADDVIVSVGSATAMQEGQHLLGRGGVLNLFGGLKKGEDVVPFDTGIIHYKEINLTGSSGGSPWDVARTLELMEAGKIDPTGHVARVGDLDHAIEFLQMVKNRALDGKAIVYPHRRTDEILAVKGWTAADEAAWIGGD